MEELYLTLHGLRAILPVGCCVSDQLAMDLDWCLGSAGAETEHTPYRSPAEMWLALRHFLEYREGHARLRSRNAPRIQRYQVGYL